MFNDSIFISIQFSMLIPTYQEKERKLMTTEYDTDYGL